MVSITHYTEESSPARESERNSNYELSANEKKHRREKAKPGEQTIGENKPTEKLQCCSIKSHKTFDPDQLFQAEMQRSPSPLTSKKKYIHLATKSTQHTLHMSHWTPRCPWVKWNLAWFRRSYFMSFQSLRWFLPAADWLGEQRRTCFTTKVWILAF